MQVSGFDLLEDEAVVDHHFMDVLDFLPADWIDPDNPGFAYYSYYVYANLVSLNQLRRYMYVVAGAVGVARIFVWEEPERATEGT